jgi:acetoin utilization deacetylase AcuC-like enzyme
MIIITDPRCADYEQPGHPENPARITKSVQVLRAQQNLKIEWQEPLEIEESALLKAHSQTLLDRLEMAVDFDLDTPAHAGIARHARRSVGGALQALRCARHGKPAFSLLRPPGHHATKSEIMGFCYLNSIAIAALTAQAEGVGRVAVFDFDVHHGNGTEDILVDRPDLAFFSIHQFPAYPGTGRRDRGKNCFNYPVPPGLSAPAYRDVARHAFDDLTKFKPDLIAVSAGFDTYARDPLCQQQLEAADFHWLGQSLVGFGVPVFSVLEGGYSRDLPELILAYLRGLCGLGAPA